MITFIDWLLVAGFIAMGGLSLIFLSDKRKAENSLRKAEADYTRLRMDYNTLADAYYAQGLKMEDLQKQIPKPRKPKGVVTKK
jgi:cell division protein FtsL